MMGIRTRKQLILLNILNITTMMIKLLINTKTLQIDLEIKIYLQWTEVSIMKFYLQAGWSSLHEDQVPKNTFIPNYKTKHQNQIKNRDKNTLLILTGTILTGTEINIQSIMTIIGINIVKFTQSMNLPSIQIQQ